MIRRLNVKQNDKITIEISVEDYKKINNTVYVLKKKYAKELLKLRKEEAESLKFDFNKFREEIINEKKFINNVINDVLKIYIKELDKLECVFLSGSYARGTNKLSSDLDLHFFYKNGEYNFIYEEIVCYIISRIIEKSRDCIDPTFILNLSKSYKEKVTLSMSTSKLIIILKSKKNSIKYSYSEGKKRRFFLQYNTSREIVNLEKYIIREIKKDNFEWNHSFMVIYGEKHFNNMYSKIYKIEKRCISNFNIGIRINNILKALNKDIKLKNNDISEIKNKFQSIPFTIIYEYISIMRLIIISNNIDIPYINLFDINDNYYNDNLELQEIIKSIYKYLWNVRKLSVFCYNNNINYGLHNHQYLDCNSNYLLEEWNLLRCILKKKLIEMEDKYYGKSYINTANDAS